MYLIITSENNINCNRLLDLLDNYNYPYINIDRVYASSAILDMASLYGCESFPVVFKLNGSLDDVEREIFHSEFIDNSLILP